MNPKAGIPWISDIVLRPAGAVNITMGKMSCSWKPRRTGFTSQSKRTLASICKPISCQLCLALRAQLLSTSPFFMLLGASVLADCQTARSRLRDLKEVER